MVPYKEWKDTPLPQRAHNLNPDTRETTEEGEASADWDTLEKNMPLFLVHSLMFRSMETRELRQRLHIRNMSLGKSWRK